MSCRLRCSNQQCTLFTSVLLTTILLTPHGSRQWLECQNNTETNLPPQYTRTYRYSYSCLIISHSSRFLQHKSAYRHQKLCRFVNDALRVQRTWRSIAGEPLHAHPSDLPILCFRIQCKKVFSDLVSISVYKNVKIIENKGFEE